MKFTMLENGLDFIISAILHLKNAEKKDCTNRDLEIKYSLLHLSSGIELLLKSRLHREHWTYIFADMNKAKKEDLKKGSFKSVDSATIIDRLGRLCNININKDSKDAFENLRRLRNQMEHFTIKENFPSIEACIHKALNAITDFIVKNYNDFTSPLIMYLKEDDANDEFGLTEREDQMIKKLIECTSELKDHYDNALKIAFAKAKDEVVLEELVKCPSCKEKLLKCNYNDSNTCQCFFCTYKEDGEKAADEYLSSIQGLNEYTIVKDGGKYPLYECSECGKSSMVNADEKYICFHCGTYFDEHELSFCSECGMLYLKNDDDLEICSSCMDYKLRKL